VIRSLQRVKSTRSANSTVTWENRPAMMFSPVLSLGCDRGGQHVEQQLLGTFLLCGQQAMRPV
jgi:hypothetical protein